MVGVFAGITHRNLDALAACGGRCVRSPNREEGCGLHVQGTLLLLEQCGITEDSWKVTIVRLAAASHRELAVIQGAEKT